MIYLGPCFFLLLSLTTAAPLPDDDIAPYFSLGVSAQSVVPNSYIVKLRDDIDGGVTSILSQLGSAKPDGIFNVGEFKGFTAKLDEFTKSSISNLSSVEYIEPNGIVRASSYQVQTDATWGLARLSHRATGNNTYVYDSSAGEGTCIYILDTGVLAEHVDFEGRVKSIFHVNSSPQDNVGHGTHVAAIIIGKNFGVSKKAVAYSLKVLDEGGAGSNADVISGLGAAVKDYKSRSCPNGAVMNLSLGGGKSRAMNDAVRAAVKAGIFVVVAAGNEGEDASNFSPASEPSAFCVAASDSKDRLARFSNHGSLINIIAPGVDIESAYNRSKNSTSKLSGTSMASPFVAGLAASILSSEGKMSPSQLAEKIEAMATRNAIHGLNRSTKNILTFNGNKFDKPTDEVEEETGDSVTKRSNKGPASPNSPLRRPSA